MLPKFKSAITLCFFVSMAAFSYVGLTESSRREREVKKANPSEVLYLPSGQGLKVISLGYNNFLSDILWFNTINYFGKHFKTDQNYKWLYHMCDLVTTLDPKADHVYEFAATMLSWEANQPKASIGMLNKAIQHLPDNWRFYYLRGFTRLYFLDDKKGAARDLELASRLSDVPALIPRLAAKLRADTTDDLGSTILFLEDMIRNAKDETARKVLKDRLNEIVLKQNNGRQI